MTKKRKTDTEAPYAERVGVQRLVGLVRSQKWTTSYDAGVEIIATLIARSQELAAIKEYLWPDQTGLPNEHRCALVAIKARERLLRRAAKKANIALIKPHENP